MNTLSEYGDLFDPNLILLNLEQDSSLVGKKILPKCKNLPVLINQIPPPKLNENKLEIEVSIDKISYEQLVSYENGVKYLIRSLSTEHRNKIFVMIKNNSSQQINGSIYLSWVPVKDEKQNFDCINKNKNGFSDKRMIFLSQFENAIVDFKIHTPTMMGIYELHLNLVCDDFELTIPIPSIKGGSFEQYDHFKVFSHRTTIKSKNPNSCLLSNSCSRKKRKLENLLL